MFAIKKSSVSALCLSCLFLAGASHAQKAWVVGQSAPLSGSNANFGRDIRDGAAAYFKSVNARGGVAGLPIELVALDDKNERKIAGANTQKLLESNEAVALFGYASATLSLDAMPQAEKAGVLFFAPFSGANPVRKSSPVVFTLRASYGDELEKMLSFWTGLGLKQVVVVHYDDEVGKQNLAVVTQYLAKQGKTPAAYSLQRNAKLGAAEVADLLKLKPDVIINTVLSGPAAEISKQIVAQGKFIPTSSLSFVGAQQYIEAAGEAGAGVSISQVVPNAASTLPVVKECAKALKDAGVSQAMNSAHLESCIGAKVLTEAMRRSKKPGDAKALLAAMKNLGSYDAGGFTVTYGSDQQHGSKYVELGMVTREGKLRN
ncbi:ABC transporter substrate-binding protein [Polaromonas sp. UC242_47]|uniref:ABC transporter substrate-binding protein n=1 Tax=Polaromonas sp. UC242_47 TaxID=3374626 RepID=UPI0037B589DA